MHHWQTFYLVVAHSEDAYLYEEKELRLINIKALGDGRELGFHSHTGWPPFFTWLVFWASIQFEFAYLSETLGKWVLLMWGVGHCEEQ